MDRRLRIGATLVLVFALLVVGAAAGVSAFFEAQKDRNTTATYHYSAEVSTNGTLADATLYLPLPVDPDGTPTVESVRISNYEGPEPNWTARVAETDRGPMLAIEADEIVGEERYYLVTENGSLARPGTVTPAEIPENMTGLSLRPALTRYEILAEVTVEPFGNGIENGLIETRYPRGNASLLSATYGYAPGACDPVWDGPAETCTAFRADLYADYETAPTTVVRVGPVELWGANEWGWFFANSFNEYTQRVEQVEFEGSHEGWTSAGGELHAGRGNY
ncbi:hypothetical protein [Halobellus rubicundus]|uniref:SipW-cognate class signal peptide n=1 Tax=Halobellus rubicundus TaxID=2996466 RepID=A0ABD5MEV3_9EURY